MTSHPGTLARVVGIRDAVLIGLGSMLGTGIFVAIGLAVESAGPAVLLAIVLAAVVATFNGLSGAALAASHPVSGGTYEYGYRYLSPAIGFVAGWMFLCAKTSSAATAALGLAGYALTALGLPAGRLPRGGLGALIALALTAVVAGGMARSKRANAAIVSIVLAALLVFVVAGFPVARQNAGAHLWPVFRPDADTVGGVLHATALLFVAYAGYGRIATLGEEIRAPGRNIPRAMVIALAAAMAVYLAVTAVAVGAVGAEALAAATRASGAPLELAARRFPVPGVDTLITVGAVAAMASVLLNLLLGLSRVALAMARRGDMPRCLAEIDARRASPRRAVLASGVLVAGLALIGSVQVTWSFSALTVLVYYALTNLAALRLPAQASRMPRAVAALGLVSCLALTLWIEPAIWGAGLGLIAVGLLWHRAARHLWGPAAARAEALGGAKRD
ncbi:MAG: APC family permease [Candidatus Binatia bacterium]